MATSKRFDLTIEFTELDETMIQAQVPAVPGANSVGRTRSEARENA